MTSKEIVKLKFGKHIFSPVLTKTLNIITAKITTFTVYYATGRLGTVHDHVLTRHPY